MKVVNSSMLFVLALALSSMVMGAVTYMLSFRLLECLVMVVASCSLLLLVRDILQELMWDGVSGQVDEVDANNF